jgi:nucleotide-binding universal stress UspA family protein
MVPSEEEDGGRGSGSLETFLVPLDGSAFAATAMVAASELAVRVGANIHLLSVVRTDDQVTEREADLAALKVPERTTDVLVVVDPDPARMIHATLRRLPSVGLCMATHASGGHPFALGPIAYKVLAGGDGPVILVGPFLGYPEGIPWVDDPILLEKFRGGGVVACVDGGARAASLVSTAVQWARLLQEPLIVITVAEQETPLLGDALIDRAFGPPGGVNAYLERVTAPARGGDVSVTSLAIFDPISPAEGIRSYLQKSPATLLVIGCQLRKRRFRAPGGRTAAAIVRRSPSPALIVATG